MARVTVTNLQAQAYVVPSPINKRLVPGETRIFDRVFLPDLERSAAFQTALADGVFSATIAQDPTVADEFEVGSQTVTPISDASVTTAKLDNLAVTTAKLDASAVTAAKTALFVSTVQTGTGVAQNIAHGLAVVPSIVMIVPVGGHNGAGAGGDLFPVIVEGAHDATNVIVTVTTGGTYKVFAMA